MPQPQAGRQRQLFEEALPTVRLPLEVQQQFAPGDGAVDAGADQNESPGGEQ